MLKMPRTFQKHVENMHSNPRLFLNTNERQMNMMLKGTKNKPDYLIMTSPAAPPITRFPPFALMEFELQGL